MWIRHAGSRAFVADPNVVTIYNRGREYTRESVSTDGDRCDWFAVRPDVAAEIGAAYNSGADIPERPFAREFAPCSPDLYLRQRRLFLRLQRERVDPLEAEEEIIRIVAEVIARAHGARGAPASKRALATRRDLVERARAQINANIAEQVTVVQLAARLATSPFHLCRVFRAGTGLTLHAYRLELRQRLLLERLAEPGASLSRIALELGSRVTVT